jgi:hypothetical protein
MMRCGSERLKPYSTTGSVLIGTSGFSYSFVLPVDSGKLSRGLETEAWSPDVNGIEEVEGGLVIR